MNRNRTRAIYALAATLAFTTLIGCKKREPAPEPEGAQIQRTETDKAAAAEPKLGQGMKLKAAGKPIDIEVGHLVPCVCD